MALRSIRLKDDEILRKKARTVEQIDAKILTLLDDMLETMYDAEGVGIAAPQVGVLRRVVVIDMREDGENSVIELINPELIKAEGSQINVEGCLSIPEESGYVERPQCVVVRALDREGNMCEYEASGNLAIAFCHELDHLDGILYIDKVIDDYEEEDKNR